MTIFLNVANTATRYGNVPSTVSIDNENISVSELELFFNPLNTVIDETFK